MQRLKTQQLTIAPPSGVNGQSLGVSGHGIGLEVSVHRSRLVFVHAVSRDLKPLLRVPSHPVL